MCGFIGIFGSSKFNKLIEDSTVLSHRGRDDESVIKTKDGALKFFRLSINDLSDKIKFYSKNDKIRSKIGKNGKTKYFKLFNETKISKYIIDISLGNKSSLF